MVFQYESQTGILTYIKIIIGSIFELNVLTTCRYEIVKTQERKLTIDRHCIE